MEHLSLVDAKKLIEKTKDKLQLFISKRKSEDKHFRQNIKAQEDGELSITHITTDHHIIHGI